MQEYVVREIKNGRTISSIAEEIGVNRRTVHTWLKKWGVDHQRLKFNHDFFQRIDSEEKAYWLGFIMADGHLCVTQHPRVVIHLGEKDEDHLWRWHKAIASVKNISRCQGTVTSTHNSKKMCDDLINLGCIPNKSLKLKFPHINKLLVRHFVRGYFDGDGSATRNKKGQLRLTFIGTTIFLGKLQVVLGTSNKQFPRGNAEALEINGNIKAGKIADWMYRNTDLFLTRKREVCYSCLRI